MEVLGNRLMINMTLINAVGTPVYMAPEILNKERYKKATDVYSFAVTMYECFKWGDAYPTMLFKFLLQFSTFVLDGKHLNDYQKSSELVFIC